MIGKKAVSINKREKDEENKIILKSLPSIDTIVVNRIEENRGEEEQED